MPEPASSLVTIARLVRADVAKLSRYWVIAVGYAAMLIVTIPGAILFHLGEQFISVTSESGYAFAFSLMIRALDFAASILFMMMCLLFSIDVANGAVKYILTRPVTRMELLLSKYATAAIMIALTLAILWLGCLGMGWYYYGLGPLTENEYVIFEASTMFRHIGIATGFIALSLGASASMAIAVSSYSSTMGGAIIVGLVLRGFVSALTVMPAALGFEVVWADNTYHFSWSSLAFTSQLFVPMYVLDDLPTGIEIERWWTWDVVRMVLVSTLYALFFFALAARAVRKRDFAL
jgi:ABC-type transport system involved in multi-copper enzyme maturation permease subunit